MKHAKGLLKLILLAAFATGAVLLVVFLYGKTPPYQSPTYFAMDTSIDFTILGRSEKEATADAETCLKLISGIESRTSRFDPGSDVSRINESAGKEPVKVSPETLEMIKTSIEYSELSGGAFDITIAPIVELWGFYSGEYRVPTESEIAEVLPLVDYRKIVVDEENSTVMLAEEGMQIDLGGVAKGYAAGASCDLLEERGVKNGLVNFGGAVGAIGLREDGKPWVVGVKDPRGGEFETVGELWLEDGYALTSGDYQRYFEEDGKRYCHIFDPRTGIQPSGAIGVTVVGTDPLVADILSTAAFIMGPEKGMELVESQEGYEALMIDSNREIIMSDGMEENYVIKMEGGFN